MLEITSIKNGFVLDHIKAGVGVKIFKYLNLEKEGNQVALIINADSKKNGKNFTVLALLSPGITINEVKNEQIIKKIKPPLPQKISGILKCNNPRCITSDEKYLEDVFDLVDENKGSYKCQYCDTIINPSEV